MRFSPLLLAGLLGSILISSAGVCFVTNALPGFICLVMGASGVLALLPLFPVSGDRILVTVLFLCLAYPFRFHIPFGIFNSFSIVELALPLAILAVWAWPLRDRVPSGPALKNQDVAPRIAGMDIAIFAYVAVNLFSVFWARRQDLTLRGIIPILENVAFYYLIVHYASNAKSLTHVIGLYLALGFVAILLSAIWFFGDVGIPAITPPLDEATALSEVTRLGSPAWGRSNYFASMMLLWVPVYLSQSVYSTSPKLRLFSGVSAVAGMLVFFFTLSRGGYLALFVGLVVWVILGAASRRLSSALVATILSVAVVSVALTLVYSSVLEGYPFASNIQSRVLTLGDPNTTSRLELWQHAARIAAENPLGIGAGNYRGFTQFVDLSVHNAYLLAALETGILGGVIFLALLFFFFRQNYRLMAVLRGSPAEPLAFGFVVSFVAILINIAVEASFEGVVFGWLFWMSQGLVRALADVGEKDTLQFPGRK